MVYAGELSDMHGDNPGQGAFHTNNRMPHVHRQPTCDPVDSQTQMSVWTVHHQTHPRRNRRIISSQPNVHSVFNIYSNRKSVPSSYSYAISVLRRKCATALAFVFYEPAKESLSVRFLRVNMPVIEFLLHGFLSRRHLPPIYHLNFSVSNSLSVWPLL
jgi:hypothetical protein